MLCWLDARSTWPGIYLFPVALAASLLAASELMRMFRLGGHEPHVWAIQLGALLPVLGACVPIFWRSPSGSPLGSLGLLAGGMVVGLLVNIAAEMLRYREPGKTLLNIALGAFAVLYVGGLLGFLVQLRLLPVGDDLVRGGMLALASMIIVVKATDIGAYTAGRLWGKHKMAPVLSPGKTWEGAAGGLLLAITAALICLGPLARQLDISRQPHLGILVDRSRRLWDRGRTGWHVGGFGRIAPQTRRRNQRLQHLVARFRRGPGFIGLAARGRSGGLFPVGERIGGALAIFPWRKQLSPLAEVGKTAINPSMRGLSAPPARFGWSPMVAIGYS